MLIGRTDDPQNPCRVAAAKVTFRLGADRGTHLGQRRVPRQLEALKGERRGHHSIRINDQWRICFVWREGAEPVEIVDYH